MKTLLKKMALTCGIAFLMVFVLIHGKIAKEFAALGLMTWYEHMIPTLLPFMIFSGILIRLDLIKLLMKPFSFFLKPLFRINSYGIYVIVMGFLCGFPIGAKNCAELYKNGKITKEEAEYLLAFTNNIGPTYFFTFVLSDIYKTKTPVFSSFLMFGIPFLYGLFLRHTLYQKKIPFYKNEEKKTITLLSKKPAYSLFEALDSSITASLVQIAMLGGYMILFNLIVLIPFTLLKGNNNFYGIIHSILEISGGFAIIKHQEMSDLTRMLLVHGVLSFNGLCCFAQTMNIIQNTNLSGGKYFWHKLVTCGITLLVIMVFQNMVL